MKPFAVPSELAAYMQAEVPEATARLHLQTASGAVRSFCRWSVAAEETTFSLRSRGGRGHGASLWLPTLYLRDVASVRVNSTLLAEADYIWEPEGCIELFRMPGGLPASVSVNASHGYLDTDPRLSTVKGVVLAAASRLVDNPLGNRSETTGGESVTMAGSGSDLIAVLSGTEREQLAPIQLPE